MKKYKLVVEYSTEADTEWEAVARWYELMNGVTSSTHVVDVQERGQR
jgi:hypothetical protein